MSICTDTRSMREKAVDLAFRFGSPYDFGNEANNRTIEQLLQDAEKFLVFLEGDEVA